MVIPKIFAISGFLITLLIVIPLNWTTVEAASTDTPRISIEQAKQMVDDPKVVFIDLRKPKSWWRSAAKIPNAVREEPQAVKQWAPKYTKDKILILYCA